MNVQDLINEGIELFNNKKFDEAIERLNQALDGIEDKKSKILIKVQHWLGRCYLEQAMKAKGKDSEQLFVQAVEHFHQQLLLAKQLVDEQNSFQEQNNAQSWLGGCYLEQAMKAKGKESEQLLGQAVEYFQQYLKLAKQLTNKQNSLQKQINAQSWLGRCYLEQAMKAKGKELFGQAVEHFQKQLSLAEQLEDKQNSIQQQINAQHSLGRCYLEQAKKVKDKESEQLFGQAVEHFQQQFSLAKQQLSLAEQLEDKQNCLQEQIYAQSWLGRCYLEQAIAIKDKKNFSS